MMMRSSGLMKRLRSCSARPAFDPPVSTHVVWLLAVPGFVRLLGDGALDLGVDLRPRALPVRPDDDLGAGISFLSLLLPRPPAGRGQREPTALLSAHPPISS